MKKILLSIACLCLFVETVLAEDNPTIFFDFGQFHVYVPLKTVNAVGLWDFVGKRSLLGAETPIAGYKRFEFVTGGITSMDGHGTPFIGADFVVSNPAENWIPLSSFRPGLYGGRDFRNDAWIFGLKASIGLF